MSHQYVIILAYTDAVQCADSSVHCYDKVDWNSHNYVTFINEVYILYIYKTFESYENNESMI